MSRQPTVVYFYMIGCPHCEAMRPAWEDAKKKLKGKKMNVMEKESHEVTSEDNVQGFPTIVIRKNGKEVKRIEGERNSSGEILRELGSNTGGRRTYRRKRKIHHRTLRNYKSFA